MRSRMMDLDGEMKNVILVWTTALASLFTCHKLTSLTAPGTTRLCTFIPFFCLFFYLPLFLTTIHFTGTISFFITWLANFKLILLAFDKGPLHSNPPLPLSRFILTACVPIKIINDIKKDPKKKSSTLSYSIKFMVFVFLLKVYEYGDHFHPLIKMALFCVHIYVVLDVGLAMVAYVARAVVGLQLEPQFDEPYLATSLQDFWGKRWNLMVTGILHPTVYLPVRSFFNKFLSRQLASLPAVMASFIVSGLMHELIFYYMGRLKPTWEVTWFFVIHGVLVCLELVVKRAVGGRLRFPSVVSGPLALGVVVATSFWLFFPPFLRCDTEVRSCKEFVAFLELVVRGRFVGPNDVSCPYL
ncbi:acyl-CoA--sterol O-acyltransferase 1-like protein [Tanacetum coccineum]|uniref:Acyl-CoA--sterol O-acyltransferase 1-like protein n=1 Tax=Tanacetum coccineum TaxID=301880 RepID=A0ABQ4Z6G5_9ASTR